jgi:hypothetical protein
MGIPVGKVPIFGRCFTQKSFSEAQQFLGSSFKTKDMIASGYTPTQSGLSDNGILYSWENIPLAFWDVPTLNNMVFSRALWSSLLENPFMKAALDSHSLWGEAFHADSDEMLIPNIALRVNNFHIADHNMVLGNMDLMDTPNGLICYSLAKTGRIGNSSRGFGSLKQRSDGLKDVVESDYLHVGWDAVTFPAVPDCMMTLSQQSAAAAGEMGTLTQHLRQLVGQALDRDPSNSIIKELYSCLTGKYQDDVRREKMSLASANRFVNIQRSKIIK